MKHLVLAGVLFAGAHAFTTRAQAQDAPKEHSMGPGCLAKGDTDGSFKLTNLEKGPKEVIIAESTANLAPHTGHKVEITGVAVPGFPFLASIIIIFSGAQLFALGIIGEYLARMYARSMDRPAYLIKEDTAAGAARPAPSVGLTSADALVGLKSK